MDKVEQSIVNQKQFKRAGGQIPGAFKKKPVLKKHLEIFLYAFFELDTERSHAMGLVKIPWSSIVNYASFYNFGLEMTEKLIFFIRRMDEENLKFLDKKHNVNIARPR